MRILSFDNRRFGVALAMIAMAAMWMAPLNLEPTAHRFCAVFVAVIVLWLTEAIPAGATGLFIAPLLIVSGVTDAKSAFAPYADPLLFLFVGGFFLAKAMERHGLDKRLAQAVLSASSKRGNTQLASVGLLSATALLSAWISNTATAALMMPNMLQIIDASDNAPSSQRGAKSLLFVAYAASIAGIMTPVGSPTNLIAMQYLAEAGLRFGFLDWIQVAAPISLLMLGLMFAWVGRGVPRQTSAELSMTQLGVASQWNKGEQVTALAFVMAVVGWLLPPLLVAFNIAKAETMETLLPASVVALLASVPLFIIRADDEQPVLPWNDAMRIDWGVILLFGGGIALGSQMIETGVAHTLSAKFIEVSHVQGLWALTAVCIAFTLLFTEVCSNMASASMIVPLAIAAANELGVPVIPPALGVGLAASCAFMLPISTGPNAIAYSTGRVSLRAMLRTGLMLELVSGVLIWLGLRALCPVFGWC